MFYSILLDVEMDITPFTEDTQNCEMEDEIEKIGVGNSTSVAKEIRDYFVNYLMSWLMN